MQFTRAAQKGRLGDLQAGELAKEAALIWKWRSAERIVTLQPPQPAWLCLGRHLVLGFYERLVNAENNETTENMAA